MASQGLLAAQWHGESSIGHVVCSLPARKSIWKACFGRVVCLFLIIFLYLCSRSELAVKAEVQVESHGRRSPLFLLINDRAAPKSGKDDSTCAHSTPRPPRDYF